MTKLQVIVVGEVTTTPVPQMSGYPALESRTDAPGWKLVPVMVAANVYPRTPFGGFMEVTMGAGSGGWAILRAPAVPL